jgi:hypothetical protein
MWLFFATKSTTLSYLCMIKLREQGTAQDVKFIPRVFDADTLIIRNEASNEVQEIEFTPTNELYYMVANVILDLKENNFYQLTVMNGADIVFKGKIFCTNQVIDDYTVNNGEYIQKESNNDFIII